MTMRPLNAVVKNGRLVVDEPTALPEGAEIELVPADDSEHVVANVQPANGTSPRHPR